MLRYFPKLPPWSNPPLQLLIANFVKTRSQQQGVHYSSEENAGWTLRNGESTLSSGISTREWRRLDSSFSHGVLLERFADAIGQWCCCADCMCFFVGQTPKHTAWLVDFLHVSERAWRLGRRLPDETIWGGAVDEQEPIEGFAQGAF